MSDSESVLLREQTGDVLLLRLNRPDKMNAINNALTVALIEAFESATKDKSVRVIGITGQGRGVCAGADFQDTKAGDMFVDKLDELGDPGRLVNLIRIRCDKPVVAGINGVAVGAGLGLAMLADMRIASSAATFNPGYARLATSPDLGVSWTVPQALGHERAMRFFLEQEILDANEALNIGMIGQIVEADSFEETFINYCQKISEVAPIAARQTKRLVTKIGLPADLDSHLVDELRLVNKGLRSADGKEAIKAVFKKTKPVFKGE